jgi:Holliday junction DNA helicase RuvA
MIIGIEGVIERKEPTVVHLNVNGLIYEIFISLNCSTQITKNNCKLHTTYIVKEDAQNLYGFMDINEKKLFDTVIKINGVGPKVALAICSTFTPNTFAQVVSNNDITMLKRVPGIGPKQASRILVELSGFVIDDATNSTSNSSSLEAALALESLGFKKDVVSKALSNCSATTTSELVKEALKKLQK